MKQPICKEYLWIFNKDNVLLLLGMILPLLSTAQKTVTILYTNDIESVYEPIDAFWTDDFELIGGIPYLATLINEVRKEEKTSFLFDAGDIFTGALSEATKGRLAFDVYSSMNYDAMALGNHEFEYGWEKLLHVKQRARFPVLNCNIFYKDTDINLCQSYTILERNGVRIGLIGVMGLEAFKNTINPIHTIGLEARHPYPIVQGIVNEIRDEVDLIVLLTHQNRSAPMQTDKEVDLEVQRGFHEDYEMAGALKDVDIIIGGHSDNGLWQPVKHPETGTLICLTFGQGKYLGYLNLEIDGTKITMNEGKLIPVDVSELVSDPEINRLVQKVRTENSELTQVIGTIDKPGYRKYYRESTIGNLFCDMLKEASNADIAFMNSGSFRADLNAGNVTVEEMVNIYPFVDKYHVVEIDGVALKELLEYSFQLTYGLSQLSGIDIKYDSNRPKGRRLIEAKINGKLLKESNRYQIATSSYLANGGDGLDMLKNGTLISKSKEDLIETFIHSIQKNPELILPRLGRQVDEARK